MRSSASRLTGRAAKPALGEAERDLNRREAALSGRSKPKLAPALVDSARGATTPAPNGASDPSEQATLAYLESLVSRFGPDAHADRLDLWRAFLVILRDHVTVSGAFPETFDEIINDVFGELVERAEDDAASVATSA